MSELNPSNIQNQSVNIKNGNNELTINAVNNKKINLQISDNNQPILVINSQKQETNYKNVVYRVLRPEDLDLKVPVKRAKHKKPPLEDETIEVPKKIFRTRSGRMSKPPKHIQQKELPEMTVNTIEEKPEETKIETIEPKKSLHKRIISSQYRCGTCKKAYLGQNKMLKHLQLNPEHVAPDFNKKELNIWPELIRKTKELPKSQQSQIFCKELINLIYKAKSVVPKLIKPALNAEESNFSVDSFVSNALGIPEGNYSFDECTSIQEALNSEVPESEIVQNDQNSLLNLLDTGQVTFDTSSNSEEVMNVDQLVNERLKTLTGGELEPSGTQNLSLDLSLDMFSYHDP